MNPSEIRDAVMAGDMTPDQAIEAFNQSRQERGQEMVVHPVRQPAPLRQPAPHRISNLPARGQLNIADIQAKDRESLKRIRADLALQVEQRSTRHEYQRQYVEESARHAIALPVVGLLGIADGALEGIGYAFSEIAETFTYTATRTLRRIKEGFERGKYQ